jgi:hypothetical protein
VAASEPLDIRPKLGNWFGYLLIASLLAVFAALPALYLFDGHPVAKVAVGAGTFVGLWFAVSRLDWRLTMALSSEGIELCREPGSKWIGGEKPALSSEGPGADRDLYWTLGSSGYRRGGGVIPWQDIEEVGTFKFRGRTIVGVRVSSIDRFLASQPPEPKSSKTLERVGAAFRVVLEILSSSAAGRTVAISAIKTRCRR